MRIHWHGDGVRDDVGLRYPGSMDMDHRKLNIIELECG